MDGLLAFIHPESGEGDDSKRISAATNWFGFSKTELASVKYGSEQLVLLWFHNYLIRLLYWELLFGCLEKLISKPFSPLH